jgi:hypothetical protein
VATRANGTISRDVSGFQPPFLRGAAADQPLRRGAQQKQFRSSIPGIVQPWISRRRASAPVRRARSYWTVLTLSRSSTLPGAKLNPEVDDPPPFDAIEIEQTYTAADAAAYLEKVVGTIR